MADTRDEYGLRHRAIELHRQGIARGVIRERLGRARSWVAKWLRRYREEGWAGLRSRSRAPQRQWQRTPDRVVARIVAIRETLEQRRTRRSRFAGSGAEVVHLELQHQRVRPVPSLSTIERILRRHGYPKRRPRRRKGGEPYPAPRARLPGDLQQTDLVGPRHLRGPRGITRFYSVHTVAIIGRGVATTQGRHKTAELLCEHLSARGARWGRPDSRRWITRWPRPAGADTPIASRSSCACICSWASISSSFRPAHRGAMPTWRASTISGRSGCSSIPVPISGPSGAPTRRSCATTTSASPTGRCGSTATARAIPDRPLARGRVSFVRSVDPQGAIDINGKRYVLGRRLVGRYITATIFTHRRMLVVKVGARRYKRFPFPQHRHERNAASASGKGAWLVPAAVHVGLDAMTIAGGDEGPVPSYRGSLVDA